MSISWVHSINSQDIRTQNPLPIGSGFFLGVIMNKLQFSRLALLILSINTLPAFAQEQPKCVRNDVLYATETTSKKSTYQTGDFGELSVSTHALSQKPNSEKVGDAVTRKINLHLKSLTPGPESMYEVSGTVFMPDGTFTTLSVSDYDKDKTTKTIERPIVGGTGKYAGARGTILIEPLASTGKRQHKLTMTMEVFCSKP